MKIVKNENIRLMAKFSGQLGLWGFVLVLVDFEFYMVVSVTGNGPIGFAAPWRFKMFDSQPFKLNMCPASLGKMVASFPGPMCVVC